MRRHNWSEFQTWTLRCRSIQVEQALDELGCLITVEEITVEELHTFLSNFFYVYLWACEGYHLRREDSRMRTGHCTSAHAQVLYYLHPVS